jgi:hypothetical protein
MHLESMYASILEVIKFGDLTMVITCSSPYIGYIPKHKKNYYKAFNKFVILVLNKNGKELYRGISPFDAYKDIDKQEIITHVNRALLKESLGLS